MSHCYLIFVLLCLVISVGIFTAMEMLGMQAASYWVALPILCIPGALLLVRKFPSALIPPVIFMGNLKSQPAASTFDLHDPTFWAVSALLVTMLVHAFLAVAGLDRPSLVERVHHARQGIITFLCFAGVVTASYLYSSAPEYGLRE